MTADNPDLRALPKNWRESADVHDTGSGFGAGYALAMRVCADQLNAALLTRTEAAADGIDPSELSSLKQRAGAWDAVAETCREIDQDALAVYGPTGRESIVNFIKQFTHPQDASAGDDWSEEDAQNVLAASESDVRMVMQLLFAGGYIDRHKLHKAWNIVWAFPKPDSTKPVAVDADGNILPSPPKADALQQTKGGAR